MLSKPKAGTQSQAGQEGVNLQGEHGFCQTGGLCPAWPLPTPGRSPGICSLCHQPTPGLPVYQHRLGDYSSQKATEARLWGKGWGVRLWQAEGEGGGGERKPNSTPSFLILSPGVSAPPPELIPQIRSPKPQLLPFVVMNGSGREGEFIF